MSRPEATPERQGEHAEQGEHAGSPLRRRWLRYAIEVITLGYLGAFLYPIYRYLVTGGTRAGGSVTEVNLGPADALAPGTGRLFQFGNFPGIIIRAQDGSLSAFNATCTHLGCTVEYRAERGIIWCPCHGGQYHPGTGAVLAGPPPRPLAPLKVAVREGTLFVSQGGPAA